MAIETIISHTIYNTVDTIKIYTDSQYSIDCVQKYSKSWENNNWTKSTGKSKEIKNLELIKCLWKYYNKYLIQLIHVKAHQPEPPNKNSYDYKIWYGNNLADKLAVMASNNSD